MGDKNACVVYPDADIKRAVSGAVGGMNFAWCGQSCASIPRLFIHESVYDQVLQGVLDSVAKITTPSFLPTSGRISPATHKSTHIMRAATVVSPKLGLVLAAP